MKTFKEYFPSKHHGLHSLWKVFTSFWYIIIIEWINTNPNTDNDIDDEGITKLSELLMTKHTLSSLDLTGDIYNYNNYYHQTSNECNMTTDNNIGDKGMQTIIELLMTNTMLTSLNLSRDCDSYY